MAAVKPGLSWQRWLQLLLSVGISAFFIWWALRGVDFAAVGRAFQRAHYEYLAPTLALFVVIQLLRCYRFKYLVAPLVDMKFPMLFRIGNISNMAVTFLPWRLGEFVRPYLLKREYGFGLSSGLGPVAAERVVDGLVVTIGFFIATHTGWQMPADLQYGGLIGLAIFVSAAVVLGIVLIGHEKGAELLRRITAVVSPRLADKVVSIVTGFAIGLRGLSKWSSAVPYVLMTLAVWGLTGVGNWILLSAFDIQQPLMVGMILVGVSVIAVMIPAAPGFVGTFQAFIVMGLTAFNVDNANAFAYSVLLHIATLSTTIAFGLFSLLRSHMSITNLVKASQAAE